MKKRLFLFILAVFLPLFSFAGDYSHLDPDHLIPEKILNEALSFYDTNQNKISNKRFLGIINYKEHNSKERFFIVDMESGRVDRYLVAHGKNSDPNFDGYATKFSNTIDSKKTSLGFYLTAETYEGDHGYSLRLDGISSTNSNARKRAIVIHSADYVSPGEKIGRSFGCPAIEIRFHQLVIDQIKGGALLFAAFE